MKTEETNLMQYEIKSRKNVFNDTKQCIKYLQDSFFKNRNLYIQLAPWLTCSSTRWWMARKVRALIV